MWENHTEKEILEVLRDIRRLIERSLRQHKPHSATLLILVEGENEMPATIQMGGAGAKAVYQEFDGPNGTGNKVGPLGTVAYSTDNPGVATVDASGNITAVGPGTANVTANDSGANLPATDSVTVVAAVQGPVSSTLTITAN